MIDHSFHGSGAGSYVLIASVLRTSAASAAFLLASSCALLLCGTGEAEPSVRGGPPTTTFLGTDEVGFVVVFCGAAEERVRPGWEKASGEDSLPQRLPIVELLIEEGEDRGRCIKW